MNQTEAECVKDLAKSMVEALGVITEKECSNCNNGKVPLPSVGAERKCHKCNGTGKVRWKWEPKLGEWCVERDYPDEIFIIGDVTTLLHVKAPLDQHIPILSWEELERVLEGVGYWLDVSKPLDKYIKEGSMKVGCSIYQTDRNDFIVFTQAKTCQEAVMRSVIQLGKELTQT